MSSEHWKSHAKDVDRDDATLPNHHLTQMRGHSQANRLLDLTSPTRRTTAVRLSDTLNPICCRV